MGSNANDLKLGFEIFSYYPLWSNLVCFYLLPCTTAPTCQPEAAGQGIAIMVCSARREIKNIPCCDTSKLKVIQLNLPCTLFAFLSRLLARLTRCYMMLPSLHSLRRGAGVWGVDFVILSLCFYKIDLKIDFFLFVRNFSFA